MSIVAYFIYIQRQLTMTLYFRPDSIKHRSMHQEREKPDDHFRFTLGVYQKAQEKHHHELQYILNRQTKEWKTRKLFVGLSIKNNRIFKLKKSLQKGEILAQLQINCSDLFQKLLQKQRQKKTIFQEIFTIGQYQLFCSFKIDSFKQINGRSQFSALSMNTNSKIQQKIKSVFGQQKNQSTNYKSRLQEQEQMYKMQNSLISLPASPRKNNQANTSANKESTTNVDISRNEMRKVQFYQGACQNTNFFSCLDANAAKSKYEFLQAPFDLN